MLSRALYLTRSNVFVIIFSLLDSRPQLNSVSGPGTEISLRAGIFENATYCSHDDTWSKTAVLEYDDVFCSSNREFVKSKIFIRIRIQIAKQYAEHEG